jgi:mRNA-degrading endonuclease toxin of MazEF toxin-antitoxin module
VNVSQVLTLDRALLGARVRALPGEAMQRVDDGLRLVLAL